MGKLILCAGSIAEHPYCFRMTRTNVYSIEEVCYYIRNNIYMMQEEVFDWDFVVWLRDELKMEETAVKLEKMRKNQDNLKDIVVTLCCSCDYFDEGQINELITIMDETTNLPPRGRQKIKADSYFRSGSLEKARKEYERILRSDDMLQAGIEEYGEILHCLGVVCCQLGEFRQAAKAFEKAYDQNQRMESLQGYLYSLRLGGLESEHEKAVIQRGLTKEQITFLDAQYEGAMNSGKTSKGYRRADRLEQLASAGKQLEYQKRVNELIEEWKKEYRSKMEL